MNGAYAEMPPNTMQNNAWAEIRQICAGSNLLTFLPQTHVAYYAWSY